MLVETIQSKLERSHLLEREVTVEFVKLYYKDDFSDEEMQRIVERLRERPS